MGDVFETTMPEQVYTDKISDLESRLHEVEMILVKHTELTKNSKDVKYLEFKTLYNEVESYFDKYKSK